MKTTLIRHFFIALALTSLFAIGSFAQKAPSRRVIQRVDEAPALDAVVEAGKFTGPKYANTALGITIDVPQGWDIASAALNQKLLSRGGELSKQSQPRSKHSELDASIDNTRILFNASTVAPLEGRANYGGLAMGVELAPASTTAKAYADYNRSSLLKSLPAARATGDLTEIRIGGEPFSAFEITSEKNGIVVRQYYVTTRRKGLLLFAVLSHLNERTEEELMNALNTLRFEK